MCWRCPLPPWVFHKEKHHPFLFLYGCGNELCCLEHQDKQKPDQTNSFKSYYMNVLVGELHTWLSIKSFVSWSPLFVEHWLVSDTRPMLVSFWQLLFSPRLLFITMSLGPSLKDWHRRATPLISTAPEHCFYSIYSLCKRHTPGQ